MRRLTYRDEEGAPHWRQKLLDDDTGWAGELIRSTVADMEDAAEKPRLNRSSWEPCEDCKEISYWDKKCDNCKYDDFFAHQEPCASCESKSKWEPYYSFCPTCGRPLTDAAWEILEKRLDGARE